jgi:hypothetical protein
MTGHKVPLLVDGHVHVYEAFDRTRFLDGAAANFRRAAADLGLARSALAGCLMMTEKPIHHVFREFRAEADGERQPSAAPWRFERTGEAESLLARRPDGETLLILAGRQVETRENLEVLALAADLEFPTDLTLPQALDAVLDSPALAVLPWGFGKWWSRRGRIIEAALERGGAGRLFLGDNSGRPLLYPTPRIFGDAAARRIWNLPGTDPLPFASEQARAGTLGFVLACTIDEERPAAAIRAAVRALNKQPRIFGGLESLARFARNQVKMQIQKRG